MKETGLAHGIAFSYGGEVGNTFDSHRLISWAAKQGGVAKADELMEHLFRRYFEQEQNLASHAVLAAAAGEAGLSAEGAAEFLATDAESAEVRAEMRGMRARHQVGGVPYFIIGERIAFSGAQDAEAIVDCFERVLAEEEEQG